MAALEEAVREALSGHLAEGGITGGTGLRCEPLGLDAAPGAVLDAGAASQSLQSPAVVVEAHGAPGGAFDGGDATGQVHG